MRGEDHCLDFVCVGAPRSGTTWLAAALDEHPGAWVPPSKEIHFFNDRSLYPFEYKYPRGIDYYRSHFDAAPEGALLGDISPLYLLDPNAAWRIHRHFPRVRVIAMLRDPVEMVYSLYVKRCEWEMRAPTFDEEIRRSPMFLDLGFYHRLLTPYFDRFPRENIHVCVFERFFEDDAAAIRDVFSFLGVEDGFRPSVIGRRVNERVDPPARLRRVFRGAALRALNAPGLVWLKDALQRLGANRRDYGRMTKRKRATRVPPMTEETRRELREMYAPDVRRLEDLLGEELRSLWPAE